MRTAIDYRERAEFHRPADVNAIKREIQRLRANGLTPRDIAAALRIDLSAVLIALQPVVQDASASDGAGFPSRRESFSPLSKGRFGTSHNNSSAMAGIESAPQTLLSTACTTGAGKIYPHTYPHRSQLTDDQRLNRTSITPASHPPPSVLLRDQNRRSSEVGVPFSPASTKRDPMVGVVLSPELMRANPSFDLERPTT